MEGNVVKKKSLTKRVLILVHHGNLCQVEGVSFVFGESEGKLKMIVGRMNKMIYNINIKSTKVQTIGAKPCSCSVSKG
jgi:hypothetical protein